MVVSGDVAHALIAHVAGRHADEYVFVTTLGNPWRYPDFYTDRWKPARTEALERGLTKHVTPHMLRHTTVVWALAEGVRIEVISEMLGHASIQITYDVYGGMVDLRDPVMAAAMAKAMLTAANALVPMAAGPDKADKRPIRPGPRGARRSRAV